MLLQQVRRFARRHRLFRAETRVLAALSGGSDSVALTLILRELHDLGELRLVGVAHFNHKLRRDASRDELFSRDLARSLDLPFSSDSEDVKARASNERRSIEDAARRARYEFFARAQREFNADVVALGHTRDDQAETHLLRLLRGAGPRGLAAMYPRRGTIVRPVLDCRRAELRAFLKQRGVAYLEDETNADVEIPRNRVRAELLPMLANRFNPAIVDVLSNEAELLRETWAWMESAADDFDKQARPDIDAYDVSRLKEAPGPLRRLALWRAMTHFARGRTVSFGHVEEALQLLDVASGSVDAPGHRVERIGDRLVLTGRRARAANLFEYPLSIPGEVQLNEAGCVLAAEVKTAANDASFPVRSGKGPVALVRGDIFDGPLAVRNRRPGDKFRPVGLGGRKKLQDYFVDRKVALRTRDLIPLVVDGSDRIVWVAGYGIDEAFRVTDASQSMLLLRLKVVGGSA